MKVASLRAQGAMQLAEAETEGSSAFFFFFSKQDFFLTCSHVYIFMTYKKRIG